MARRCAYSDKSKRGPRSPECFPGTFASHIVRAYFITPRGRKPLYLCRAHAEFHAHLNPQRIASAAKPVNVIQAVVDALNAQHVVAFNEHPGVVHIPLHLTLPNRDGDFWAGTVNETWMIDRQSDSGEVLSTHDTGIPSTSDDIGAIVTAIREHING